MANNTIIANTTTNIQVEVSVYATQNGAFQHCFTIDDKNYVVYHSIILVNNLTIESSDGVSWAGIVASRSDNATLSGKLVAKLYKEVVFLPYTIRDTGTFPTTHYLRGKMHRSGGLPARVYDDGDEDYYENGLAHRMGDLPASIRKAGITTWCINGKLHRDNDKPAKVSSNGVLQYYKNGKEYTPAKVVQTEKIVTMLPDGAANITAVVDGQSVVIQYGKK